MEVSGITNYLRKNNVVSKIMPKSNYAPSTHAAEFYTQEGKLVGQVLRTHGGYCSGEYGGILTSIKTYSEDLKLNFTKVVRQYMDRICIDENDIGRVIPRRIITDITETDYEKAVVKKTRKVRELQTTLKPNEKFPPNARMYKLEGEIEYKEEIINQIEEPYIKEPLRAERIKAKKKERYWL